MRGAKVCKDPSTESASAGRVGGKAMRRLREGKRKSRGKADAAKSQSLYKWATKVPVSSDGWREG